MLVARDLRITGKVQGVFFRAWARCQAEELGVSGWVRNCHDGSVEAHLEGHDGAVRQLVQRMREGPPGAKVDDLAAKDTAPEGFSGFEVRH
jgi:acylphosphatase